MTFLDGTPIQGLYIGLISGTSMDGADLALIALKSSGVETVSTRTAAFSADLRGRLIQAIEPAQKLSLHDIATLDIEVAQHFAKCVNETLKAANVSNDSVVAIGTHGQTLRHHPVGPMPYSWQIGNAATIAALTGITTVADFRSMDVAFGGQGAPLVPPFHQWCFSSPVEQRVVANIGGIANISVLSGQPGAAPVGYDCGPGNCLMDVWTALHRGEPFDNNGEWSASGKVIPELLNEWLRDEYFAMAPPKSTGREMFNIDFISRRVSARDPNMPACDVQATLAQLTTETIARAVELSSPTDSAGVFVCGGGAFNENLMTKLRARLPARHVATTAELGVAPDFVEATAFAWLAQQRISNCPVRLTTSIRPQRLLLGAVHEPRIESWTPTLGQKKRSAK